MISVNPHLILPSTIGIAVGFFVFGTFQGISWQTHEFVNLRSGFKCTLRVVIVSATVSAIASATWALSLLISVKTGLMTPLMMTGGFLGYRIFKYNHRNNDPGGLDWFDRYERIVKQLLDWVI